MPPAPTADTSKALTWSCRSATGTWKAPSRDDVLTGEEEAARRVEGQTSGLLAGIGDGHRHSSAGVDGEDAPDEAAAGIASVALGGDEDGAVGARPHPVGFLEALRHELEAAA